MGAFSLLDGKNLPIEEDVRVPFFIRGPGIPAGQVRSAGGVMCTWGEQANDAAAGCKPGRR